MLTKTLLLNKYNLKIHLTQHRFYNPSPYMTCKYTSDNSKFMKNEKISQTYVVGFVSFTCNKTTLLNKYNSTYIIQHGFI